MINSHIGIMTANIEKSIKFYQNLGFKILHEYFLQTAQPTKVAFMALNGLVVELYQHLKGDKTAPSQKLGSINHFAITVKSLEDVMLLLKKHNIAITEGPINLPFGENGMNYLIIEGPMGERIEFDEWL